MALGAAVLLLAAAGQPKEPGAAGNGFIHAVEWLGRLSCELYLFHLVVLGLMRTVLPPRRIGEDWRLVLVVLFLAVSTVIAAKVGRCFAEPLNSMI